MRAILLLLLLAGLGRAGEGVRELMDRLESADPAERHRAAEALGALGTGARPAFGGLVDLLADRESWVRIEAARAIVRIGAAGRDVRTLVLRLENADLDVGLLLADAVAAVGPAAVPELVEAAGGRGGRVKQYALAALRTMGKDAAAAVPALLDLLADADPAIEQLAGEALRRAGPWAEAMAPEIVQRLGPGDEKVRFAAARVLGQIGPAARDAIPVLRAMLEDDAPRLRDAAAAALKQIDVRREKAAPHEALAKPHLAKEKAPERFRIRFETTRGEFIVEVERAWAPNGADRLYNLAAIGFFTDMAVFRVVKTPRPFVAQFGIHDESRVRTAWAQASIEDDPVTQSNRAGTVAFAMAGPDTRTTQVFVNLGDNALLDKEGSAPVGRVVEGMKVVQSLYSGYGEKPDQNMIYYEGNTYLKREFPELDYIRKATLIP